MLVRVKKGHYHYTSSGKGMVRHDEEMELELAPHQIEPFAHKFDVIGETKEKSSPKVPKPAAKTDESKSE